MTIKNASELKLGDILNHYDQVSYVGEVAGGKVRVNTLCYISSYPKDLQITVGSKFIAWFPSEPDAASSEFEADTWFDAWHTAMEYLEVKQHGYVGKIIVQNTFNNERKTFMAKE